ncbi:biotin synthase [Nitratifractor salsuginis]|uniref:Biotin synthase n=1 Tax=Nitratifractor salsuginis (strain DSM 16511 / JCM 12458 / E9I37-1) TaxID=749222 RepID=E6WZ23_NITSE|nr:biotin synthase [Nitratifractor salsuginis]ADV45473.1 biotin synthase [Nitratifractor salsuginis DSM 16511]
MNSKEIFLCAINNVLSGTCNEDCKFCTQSVRYKAAIDRYTFKEEDQVLQEAKEAAANGALGYCLVTAGKGLDDRSTEYIARLADRLSRELPTLRLIACNGTATSEQLRHLKAHGISSYNHNLETSEAYYPEICTTHGWQERYATCEAVKSAGLSLCSGGIFGMGESQEDRESLLQSIRSLDPDSVPLNFYIPNPALPIPERTIDRKGGLRVIRRARQLMPELPLLMVAGGREGLFGGAEGAMFDAGANAIVIGNYLTTPGEAPDRDRQMIRSLGYRVATECHGS